MSRRIKWIVVGAVILTAIILVVLLVNSISGPLAGEFSHDFGEIAKAPAETVELSHAFKLTNRTDEPINIVAARPNCSCVNAREGLPTWVDPGETFDLRVKMAFQGTDKTVLIFLDMADHGEQVLRVHAKATAAN